MIDPRANENQLMFPAFENIRGTIKAAVIVGEIKAIFCANNSTKLRQCGLSLFSGCVLMVSFSFTFVIRFLWVYCVFLKLIRRESPSPESPVFVQPKKACAAPV